MRAMVYSLAEDASPVARRRVPMALGVGAGCYLLLLVLGGRLLHDPDTFWHIALGDWIVAHAQVPHVDMFSATMAGAPWISSEWLSQVVFAQVFAYAGWTGIVVLGAAAIATALGLLTHVLLEKLAVGPALVLTLGAFVLISPHLVARPHALALPVMVAWVAGLVRAVDERRAPPFALLPLMTLWANLHGGFTFGIAFIAPLALEALWNAAPSERVRVVLRWGLFGVLAVAAACLTPYGPESILVTRRILGLGQVLALIGEWQPQNFSRLAGFELCLLLGIGAALYRGLTLPPIRILVLLGLLHMALSHNRSVDLLGLLAPLILAAPLAPQIGQREAEPSRARCATHYANWAPALAMILALAIASVAAGRVFAYQPDPHVTPARAVAAMKATGKTHILNSYDFGGYLIASGFKPFIDGRTEVYGEAFTVAHTRALMLSDVGGFLQLLHKYDIDVTLLAVGTPAAGLLDRLEGWKRIYADDIAVVHVRTASPKAGSADILR
jgi:hypothetical protein